ncbi:hypothetical protein A2765_03590 [Candidatus Kaiserbacteria bacterium RIFCSPHIGHO2_01_FULL_56_24]|uniref:Uncharacterized protein n=1 Tax=Candidatus Kaiserbacteria bacterium RIFCSPHIGHO2_01_FULL_56_24 TaxID=1798487 RepID=A0A1F6DGT2_9BACT|nr:MAG: hypothetical protein A2765_03590 [Candidatus Kaiserbacteria bacterium RIFCSPHIGHO2_01_FULL_56_24]
MNVKVKVRVIPGAKKEKFDQRSETEFSASVKERPERNEANARVQALVARHFNVPVTSVRFLTGARGRSKLFEVVR